MKKLSTLLLAFLLFAPALVFAGGAVEMDGVITDESGKKHLVGSGDGIERNLTICDSTPNPTGEIIDEGGKTTTLLFNDLPVGTKVHFIGGVSGSAGIQCIDSYSITIVKETATPTPLPSVTPTSTPTPAVSPSPSVTPTASPSPTIYIAPLKSSFPDVETTHFNYTAIEYAKEKGIVKGYTDGTFQAEKTLSRAEFTKIIVAALVPESEITGSSCFTDIADEWYAKYVCTAKTKKLLGGYSDGTFKPSANINFSEAAKILSNAFGLPSTTDAEVWFRPYVKNLSDLSVIPHTVLSLSKNITRGEMVEMMYRLKEDFLNDPAPHIYTTYDSGKNVLNTPYNAFLESGEHVKGASESYILLYIYSDYHCPYSKKFNGTANEFLKNHPQEVFLAYAHFPLDELHPDARKVAEASECINELGGNDKFWAFTDKAYTYKNGIPLSSVESEAVALGINKADYQTCMTEERYKVKVQESFLRGVDVGIQGTPGVMMLNVLNGKAEFVPGAVELDVLEEIYALVK